MMLYSPNLLVFIKANELRIRIRDRPWIDARSAGRIGCRIYEADR
jgi:hypothetical protein